jgi:CheY-like chemotaxis protein
LTSNIAQTARRPPETAHTKIVILTALSQPADQARAKELGADEYLVKSQAVISDVMKRISFHLGVKPKEDQAA